MFGSSVLQIADDYNPRREERFGERGVENDNKVSGNSFSRGFEEYIRRKTVK